MDAEAIAAGAANVLKTGWSYLSWGAKKAAEKAEEVKLTEKLSSAAEVAKRKAQEAGL